MMELTTDDFIAAFGEELQTRHYDEILSARDAEVRSPSDDEPSSDDKPNDELMEHLGFKKASNSDEIKKALGEESYANLDALANAKGLNLKDLAKSIGITPKQLRKGVKEGSRFPRKPGAFDAMCRQLGFQPSEAREKLGGIYEARARGERIEARMSIYEKLQEVHAVYRRIADPSNREAAEYAIDALLNFLCRLADKKG